MLVGLRANLETALDFASGQSGSGRVERRSGLLAICPAALLACGVVLVTALAVDRYRISAMPLSDTHLVLLSAGSQRDDGLLPRPDKLVGIALNKLRDFLIRAALVDEVAVRTDQPHWSKTEAEQSIGLRITPAGLAAIGIEQPLVAGKDKSEALPSSRPTTEQIASTDRAADQIANGEAAGNTPRAGSKAARLIALLAQDCGVTVAALVEAFGWQPHTVRAALTRLRQSGMPITKGKDEQGRTVYRSAAAAQRDAELQHDGEAA